jgi:large subunit ribosomal protein L25
MKTVSINGTKRENVGKKDAKGLRRENLVPCVLYGNGENIHFSVDTRDMDKLVYTGDVYNVLINIDGTEHSAVVRDVQFHPVTDAALHADFLAVTADKPVTIKMPINLVGNAIGVRNGGKLRQPMRKLSVTGLISALPDAIEVEIENLRIGKSIKVGELSVEGVTFNDPASNVVVAVKMARGAVLDTEEEEEATEEAAE